MAGPRKARPDVITYGDHEVITPDTSKFRKTIRPAAPDDPDPVATAEQALAEISNEFSTWMHDECERLDKARHLVRERGLSKATRQELFLAAHDVKGDCGAFGYPEVAPAADSLCRLLEHAPDLKRIPLGIVDQHVDAVRAIVREHSRSDVASIAAALTSRLRLVTDEFLIAENRHRPEYLKLITAQSSLPSDTF